MAVSNPPDPLLSSRSQTKSPVTSCYWRRIESSSFLLSSRSPGPIGSLQFLALIDAASNPPDPFYHPGLPFPEEVSSSQLVLYRVSRLAPLCSKWAIVFCGIVISALYCFLRQHSSYANLSSPRRPVFSRSTINSLPYQFVIQDCDYQSDLSIRRPLPLPNLRSWLLVLLHWFDVYGRIPLKVRNHSTGPIPWRWRHLLPLLFRQLSIW